MPGRDLSAHATDSARAFWVVAPGRGEIRDDALPPAAAGDVVITTLWSAISRGTESIVFGGRVPESEHARMRAPFQAGEFPAPVKYGYAAVGRVDHGPADLLGRAVFVLYPHQTRFVVPASAVHVVPEQIPPERAVLAANLETALNVVWDAHPHIGDGITVIGGGTVGCLVARLMSRIAGCDVELVDVNPERASIARILGVRFAEPATATPERDVVIHTSGSPGGLELALGIAGFEARITEASWFGDQRAALPLGGGFHARRLTIASSQVGQIAASQRPRWNTKRRMQLALRLLDDPALDALITGESPFDELPHVMARLSTDPGNTICHRIRYGQESGIYRQESGIRNQDSGLG